MSLSCPRCGYELTIVKEGVCPECGLALRVVEAGTAWDEIARRRMGLLGLTGLVTTALVLQVIFLEAKKSADAANDIGRLIGSISYWVWYQKLDALSGASGVLAWIGLVGSMGLIWIGWRKKVNVHLSRRDKRAFALTIAAVIASAIGATIWYATYRS